MRTAGSNRYQSQNVTGCEFLTDGKRPGATVLSPFVFLDTREPESPARNFALRLEAADHGTSKTRNQRWIDFLRSTGVLALALFGIRGKCPFLRDCTWVLAPFLGLYLVLCQNSALLK